MRILSLAALAATIAVAPLAAFAQSDDKFLTVCPFSKGDPVSKVRQFYALANEPQRLDKVTPGGTAFQYHLAESGVWVFFDNALVVSSVRFDAPFQGKIRGIGVGDDADHIRALKGEPARKFQGFLDNLASENREQKVLDIINALPDPSPKAQVARAFERIVNLEKAPPDFTAAWVYNPGGIGAVTYDIGIRGVQSILTSSCQPET
jgi:hypothetical protein